MELNFKVLGEGKSIIILHGLFGMLDNWKTFGRQLAEDYQVFLVDQRDHGRSPHTDSFDYRILAQDLHDFIEFHKIEPFAIIGHSMGGKASMQFTHDYPGINEKLIVVDIGPLENEVGHAAVFDALYSFDPSKIKDRKVAEQSISTHLDEQGVIQFLMKNLSRSTEGGFRWKMNLDLLKREYANILAAVELTDQVYTETLFIRGGNSNYIDDKNVYAIDDAFIQAEVVTIEEAGHWVHAEKPEELLDIVKEFLLG